MKRLIPLYLLLLLGINLSFAQNSRVFKSWNPATDSLQVLDGQGWRGEIQHFYDRLPARAEQTVRKEVWNLSKHGAGLFIRFRSNADEIVVKYAVTGNVQMPHMPATGVSGVDLYARNSDGKWLWCAGRYNFGDTISYRFVGMSTKDQYGNDYEYYLYLPLYNAVKWMDISVPQEAIFKPLAVRKEKPIVVYGTSIAQGGCATRPGLGWTSILGRKLDRRIINLAFSGNGRLEPEVVSLIAELDPSLYVLDCLPNLVGVGADEVKKRLVASIGTLQQKRPGTPILLTEHDSYTDEGMNASRKASYETTNKALKEVYDSLIVAGAKHLFLLTKNEINQDIESMVDGTHPNDIGMMHYAEAYDKTIRRIMREQVGTISTEQPVIQHRQPKTYEWDDRHNQILAYNRAQSPKLFLIGNSITHNWGGKPSDHEATGADSWNKYFEPKRVVNLGYGWDRIENVLWRVYHGELDSVSPDQIVIMIGTNNLAFNTNEEIIDGLQFLVQQIRLRQARAKIVLLGILPRRAMEQRIASLNSKLASAKYGPNTKYADAGGIFLKKDRTIDEGLFSDGLHPNAAGYERLGQFINRLL